MVRGCSTGFPSKKFVFLGPVVQLNNPHFSLCTTIYTYQRMMPGDLQEDLGDLRGDIGPMVSEKERMANIYSLVLELTIPEKRETALLALSKLRETVHDLAPILWHSFGTIAALIQEIVTIYPLLSPPKLKAHASNRVCNALALLQCVASHPETRTFFLNGILIVLLRVVTHIFCSTHPAVFISIFEYC